MIRVINDKKENDQDIRSFENDDAKTSSILQNTSKNVEGNDEDDFLYCIDTTPSAITNIEMEEPNEDISESDSSCKETTAVKLENIFEDNNRTNMMESTRDQNMFNLIHILHKQIQTSYSTLILSFCQK